MQQKPDVMLRKYTFEDKARTFEGEVLVQIQKMINIGAPQKFSDEGLGQEEDEMMEEKEEKFENKYLEACGNEKGKSRLKE